MKVKLQRETQANGPFVKFLYDSLREVYSAETIDFEDGWHELNVQGRGFLSTVVEWNGLRLYFDLCDHAFIWNLDALTGCDLYFKANLHWGIAERYLPESIFAENRRKIAPFLLFAPDIKHLRRFNSLYQGLGAFSKKDVCHIVGIYRNLLRESGGAPIDGGVPAGLIPDHYHFWLRYQVHQSLRQSGLNVLTKLTSKGQKKEEDGIVIHPFVKKRDYFRYIAGSRYQFVNILPHALLPWKATEGIMLGSPLIVDHNPLMELPYGFELEEKVHFLSLLGQRFDFEAIADRENAANYRLLNPVPESEWNSAFDTLIRNINDKELFESIRANVLVYRDQQLTSENLCNTIEHYVRELL